MLSPEEREEVNRALDALDVIAEFDTQLDQAVQAGLTRRWGPDRKEVKAWPLWKRVACRLTPRKYRWRYSAYAPLIREYDSRI